MDELKFMQVEKRTVKLPPPYATESEALQIKHHLVDLGRRFSAYAIEAIKEKMERDKQKKKGR